MALPLTRFRVPWEVQGTNVSSSSGIWDAAVPGETLCVFSHPGDKAAWPRGVTHVVSSPRSAFLGSVPCIQRGTGIPDWESDTEKTSHGKGSQQRGCSDLSFACTETSSRTLTYVSALSKPSSKATCATRTLSQDC